MINLDAIKTSGENSDNCSFRLLEMHRWRERVEVDGLMLSRILRDGITSEWYEILAKELRDKF